LNAFADNNIRHPLDFCPDAVRILTTIIQIAMRERLISRP